MDEDGGQGAELRMLGDVRRVTELEVRREAKGLSWTGLGIALGLARDDGSGFDVKTPRGWEERRHVPYRAAQRKLCAFLQVGSIAELGLGRGLEAARHRAWMTEEERNVEVDRRRFCIVTGAALGASVLPVSNLVAGAQLLDGRRNVGAPELTVATEVATDLASRYAATPNVEVFAAAKAHAYTLADLLQSATMSPGTRTRLQSVASDAACLVGYGHLNAGWLNQADAWFADGLTLARQAEDRRLEAYALASSGWIPHFAPGADQQAVVDALEAAGEFHPFLPPAGRAWVFSYLAREHAVLGDDLVSGRFLELARSAAALVPYDEPGWGLFSVHAELAGWDEVRPEVFSGVRSLKLGRPAEALESFDTVFDRVTMPVRRATLHEDSMRACVGLGDPDRACATAVACLDEARTHGLRLFSPLVRTVRRTFSGDWDALPPVRELDERLALVS